MANRYQLGPYRSVYRDPQSVAVNELLRERFVQAFTADDMLAAAVDQMKAADFAGDKEAFRRISDATRAGLEERAASGRYEYAGMDVAKAARSFEKNYQPIKTNYEAVESYKAELKKAYEDGRINSITYQNMLAMSSKGYDGLKFNPDGSVDDNSYFKGISFVDDVDISADFDERMKEAAFEEFAGATGQYEVSKDGTEYYVETDTGYKKMSKERVKAIFDDMISDPKYQAALNQQSRIATYNLSDDDIKERLLKAVDGDVNDPESTGLKGMLAELSEKGKDKEAAVVQSIIDEYEAVLTGDPTDTPETLEAKRRAFARELNKQSTVSDKLGTAYKKFAITQTTKDDYKVKYSERQLDLFKRSEQEYIANANMKGSALQWDNPAGNTIESVSDYATKIDGDIKSQVQNFNNLGPVKDLNNGQPGQYTEEQIIRGDIPESLLDISKGVKDFIVSQRLDISIQARLLEDAVSETNAVNKVLESKDLYKGLGGKEILDLVGQATGNSNLSIEDVQDFYNTWKNSRKSGQVGMGRPYAVTPSNFEGFGKILKEKLKIQDNPEIINNAIDGVLNNFNKVSTTKYTDVVNEKLEKSTTKEIPELSTTLPGFDPGQIQDNTKAIRDLFVGKGVPSGLPIGYSGRTNVNPMDPDYKVTSILDFRKEFTKGDLREKYVKTPASLKSWQEDPITVKDVLFHQNPGPFGSGIALIVGNKNGDTEELFVSLDNVGTPGIDSYKNSVGFRARLALNQAESKGLKSFEYNFLPDLGNAEAGLTSMKVTFRKGQSDIFQFNKNLMDGDKVIIEKDKPYNVTDPQFITVLNAFDLKKQLPF